MEKKVVVWITFNAFLDTDLYVVKELKKFYKIDWYIIRSENDKFEYLDVLEKMNNQDDLTVNLHICGRRLRKVECISFYRTMLAEIREKTPNIIFTSMAGAPYFIPVLALSISCENVIMAIHNVHVPKGGSAYYFFKLYNQLTVKHFKHFFVYSKSQYRDLKIMASDKDIAYAPFILKDYGKANNKRTSELVSFLNFGNVRDYKRLDVLISAAQKAYEKTGIKFRVIIAGKCENWEKYQQNIKYDFLFDIRIGRVENSEVANLFNECDYFVAPYQDIAQSGSSVVAINYGKPIIASKLPAFEEYIDDGRTGFLIRPANMEDLTKVMSDILNQKSLDYHKMVDNLKKSREYYFSTTAIVKKYREFFDNVIQE